MSNKLLDSFNQISLFEYEESAVQFQSNYKQLTYILDYLFSGSQQYVKERDRNKE